MNLKGKIAIVTGASRGLGAALVKMLITEECIVYGIARDKSALDLLYAQLGDGFHSVPLDLTDEMELTNWMQHTFSQDYIPDILINNAGTGSFQAIDQTSTATWLSMIDINLNALFYITSQVAGWMKQKESSSHIINIGSILGKVGRNESTAYCTTKFGVRGFSEALFMELRHFNIKVTSVLPGSIETDFFKSSDVIAHQNMLQPSDIADTIAHVLKTPNNLLINEIELRPLNPKKPT